MDLRRHLRTCRVEMTSLGNAGMAQGPEGAFAEQIHCGDAMPAFLSFFFLSVKFKREEKDPFLKKK